MILASEYYNPTKKLGDNIKALSDPDLDYEINREDVNRLVLNFVINYLIEYFELPGDHIYDIRNRINELLHKKYSADHDRLQLEKKAIMSGGNLYDPTDLYALQCLTSTHSTAAIVKEIIFYTRYSKNGDFTSLDLGSGTGILLAASLISATRRQIKNINGIGIEQSQESVRNSRILLDKVFPGICEIREKDLMKVDAYNGLDKLPLKFIISETFSSLIPPVHLDGNGRVVIEKTKKFTANDTTIDPFPAIMTLLFNNVKKLGVNIEDKQIAFFPNFITGLYKPNYEDSIIHLLTFHNKSIKLEDVGNEFSGFEKLLFYNANRWEPFEV